MFSRRVFSCLLPAPCSPLPLPLCLLVQFEDSEEDFDSRFDTDDELSYRRDSVYSCVTLPYFHSFLYMKGTARSPHSLGWGKAMENQSAQPSPVTSDGPLR